MCEKSDFFSAKSLKNHIKNIHNSDNVRYNCEMCDYQTGYKYKLKKHQDTENHHKGGRPSEEPKAPGAGESTLCWKSSNVVL